MSDQIDIFPPRPVRAYTTESDSLSRARDHVRAARRQGVHCPCCQQYAKEYRRPITAPMARALVEVYRFFQRNPQEPWLHVGEYLSSRRSGAARGGDFAKLTYWGLLEAYAGERNDGSKRVGYYRITDAGRAFVEGRILLPKYACVYAGQMLGLDDTESVSIEDALGAPFNFHELMTG